MEVESVVEADEKAHFYWGNEVEFSHDCFVCRRTRRTVILKVGADQGGCVSSRKPSELVPAGRHNYSDVSFVHPAPIRISAYDKASTSSGEQRLRARLSFWWASFEDAKDLLRIPSPLTANPWVRLSMHLGCRACLDAGHDAALGEPGLRHLQTNLVWPITVNCPTCKRTLLTATSVPHITLVDA